MKTTIFIFLCLATCFATEYAVPIWNSKSGFNKGLDQIFLIVDDTEASSHGEGIFNSVATNFQQKLNFFIVKAGDKDGDILLEMLRVSKVQLPFIFSVRLPITQTNLQKFFYDSELTVDNLNKFVQDFLEGKLKPYYKSQPLPEESFEENFRVVVGKTFKEIVQDPEKDVLILCDTFIYSQQYALRSDFIDLRALSAKFKGISGLVVAKMNIEENEALNAPISTGIWLYPKGKKGSPIEIDERISEKDLISLLKDHSVSFEGLDVKEATPDKSILSKVKEFFNNWFFRGEL